ncbi:MAG TPA: response regulator [Flavitalea sp.]|nr:response regulator [Flavitalea sp.]
MIGKRPEVKILVVDDREDNLFSIETILEGSGYTIIKANSGRAALKVLLKQQDITIILMDVQMPDLNGFETAGLIYERDRMKGIPIIFITAHDHGDENIFKGYQLGGVDYLYKPINPELLKAKVAVFVELHYRKHEMLIQEQNLLIANRNLEKEVAERKNSEEKIRQLNSQLITNIDQLRATNEELERFAYVASHDLQEPLRKIILFCGMLHVDHIGRMDDEGKDLFTRIVKASERMQQLIGNLLSFSRASNESDHMEPTDLNVLLQGIISDLEAQVTQKQANIQVSWLPVLSINPTLVRQVFQNLIINALKFSKEDLRPEILIYADEPQVSSSNSDAGPMYNIYVKDNGIGFDMIYKDQVFIPFKRLHTQDQFEGTGIGLSICKKIIEKHNGVIDVFSEETKGTTFIISLPDSAVTDTRESSDPVH